MIFIGSFFCVSMNYFELINVRVMDFEGRILCYMVKKSIVDLSKVWDVIIIIIFVDLSKFFLSLENRIVVLFYVVFLLMVFY